jgi:hypothetical protein
LKEALHLREFAEVNSYESRTPMQC